MREKRQRAGIPGRFSHDDNWHEIQPTWASASDGNGRYASVQVEPQLRWLRALQQKPEKFLTMPMLYTVLGTELPHRAYSATFGLARLAQDIGLKVRCFRSKGFEPPPYDNEQVSVLYGVHTDDTQIRRQLVRDWLSPTWSDRPVCRILMVYGDEPLEFVYQKLGAYSNALFMFETAWRPGLKELPV